MTAETRIEVHEDRTSITFMSPGRRSEGKAARGDRRIAPRKRMLTKRRMPAANDAAAVQALLTPAELDRFVRRLRGAVAPLPSPESTARLVSALTGGRVYSVDERIQLESDALLRGVADRRRLLHDAVTAGEAGRILGRTRQAVHDRVKAGTLLAINDSGVLRFPLWQFDTNAPRGVVQGLPDILGALDISPLAKARWLTQPDQTFEGRTPLEALKAGEIDRVRAEARGVGQA